MCLLELDWYLWSISLLRWLMVKVTHTHKYTRRLKEFNKILISTSNRCDYSFIWRPSLHELEPTPDNALAHVRSINSFRYISFFILRSLFSFRREISIAWAFQQAIIMMIYIFKRCFNTLACTSPHMHSVINLTLASRFNLVSSGFNQYDKNRRRI